MHFCNIVLRYFIPRSKTKNEEGRPRIEAIKKMVLERKVKATIRLMTDV